MPQDGKPPVSRLVTAPAGSVDEPPKAEQRQASLVHEHNINPTGTSPTSTAPPTNTAEPEVTAGGRERAATALLGAPPMNTLARAASMPVGRARSTSSGKLNELHLANQRMLDATSKKEKKAIKKEIEVCKTLHVARSPLTVTLMRGPRDQNMDRGERHRAR